MNRVPLRTGLTRREMELVTLIAQGRSNAEIACLLRIRRDSIRTYTRNAASKIPGDLPARARILAWYRGAPLSVLCPTAGP